MFYCDKVPKQKHFNNNGISIMVSPNIVFRITINGVKYIGACKIHISKGKIFSNKQSKLGGLSSLAAMAGFNLWINIRREFIGFHI